MFIYACHGMEFMDTWYQPMNADRESIIYFRFIVSAAYYYSTIINRYCLWMLQGHEPIERHGCTV